MTDRLPKSGSDCDPELSVSPDDREYAFQPSAAKVGLTSTAVALVRRSIRDAASPHHLGFATLELRDLSDDLQIEIIARMPSFYVFDPSAQLLSVSLGGLLFREDVPVVAGSVLEAGCLEGTILVRLVACGGRTAEVHCTHQAREGVEKVGDSMLAVPLARPGKLKTDSRSFSVVDSDETEELAYLRLESLRSVERDDCVFCGRVVKLTREHIVPDWALASGETGMTVGACAPCNGSLGKLEDSVSQRAWLRVMDSADQGLLLDWPLKTRWAIHEGFRLQAFAIPGGLGPYVRNSATGVEHDGQIDTLRSVVSLEHDELQRFLKWGEGVDGASWLMLRVGTIVASLCHRVTEIVMRARGVPIHGSRARRRDSFGARFT